MKLVLMGTLLISISAFGERPIKLEILGPDLIDPPRSGTRPTAEPSKRLEAEAIKDFSPITKEEKPHPNDFAIKSLGLPQVVTDALMARNRNPALIAEFNTLLEQLKNAVTPEEISELALALMKHPANIWDWNFTNTVLDKVEKIPSNPPRDEDGRKAQVLREFFNSIPKNHLFAPGQSVLARILKSTGNPQLITTIVDNISGPTVKEGVLRVNYYSDLFKALDAKKNHQNSVVREKIEEKLEEIKRQDSFSELMKKQVLENQGIPAVGSKTGDGN